MRGVIRTVIAFSAGAAAMLALEAVTSRRGGMGNPARRLLDRIRPAPVADDTVEARVRKTLARAARQPEAIAVSIEHGCVDLRGPVATSERARIVRAIAAVPGVDSVLDLMTEPPPGAAPAVSTSTSTSTSLALTVRPTLALASRWVRPSARIIGLGTGLGVVLSAFTIGGLLALPVTALGMSMFALAAADLARGRRRETDGAI